jgi:hypothetical protein
MKTATKKSAIRSTDELWQWAALKRSSTMVPKPSIARSVTRHSSAMAQGILCRLYEILRSGTRVRR